MKIGFLLNRFNLLSNYGPVIEAAFERGHEVILFCLRNAGDSKEPSGILEEKIPVFSQGRPLLAWFDFPQLAECAHTHGAQALILIEGVVFKDPTFISQMQLLRAQGVRVISISHFFEGILGPVSHFENFDRVCYQSAFGIGMHTQVEPALTTLKETVLAEKIAVTGSSLLDQFRDLKKDGANIRKKYGIPEGKKIVLFLSLKMAVPENWRRFAFGETSRLKGTLSLLARRDFKFVRDCWTGISYLGLLRCVKNFAERSGACLVVKTRFKNQDPMYVKQAADVFIQDGNAYPYTSAELMAIADLCIHFQSGAVMEAAFAKVPSLAIAIPQEHLRRYNPLTHRLYFEEGEKEGSLYKFQGVSTSLPLKEAYALLSQSTLSDFAVDPEQRDRYIQKYLGFGDYKNSHRILEVVEKTLS